MAVLTSQFFLSDEGDDVEMPLHIDDGRASLQQKVDFNCGNNCPQMSGYRKSGRLITVGMATVYWTLYVGSASG